MNLPRPRIGILGAAKIAPKALIEPGEGLFDFVAVAARDEGRGREFARANGIARGYESYEALVEAPDVDVVYVALPASHHVEWTLRALAAGKHVLSEKPFALGADEAERAVQFASERGLVLMEAHHSDYHPLRELFAEAVGRVGALRSIRLWFDAPIHAGDIRLAPELGAGVLVDFGCYLSRWLRWCSTEEFRIRRAEASLVAPEIDQRFFAELEGCESGVSVTLTCDMSPEIRFRAGLEVVGEEGRVIFENPLGVEGSLLRIRSGESERIVPAVGDSTYRGQALALHRALTEGKPSRTMGDELVVTQKLIDRLYQAAGLLERRELAKLASTVSSTLATQ